MATALTEGRQKFAFGTTVWQAVYRHDQSDMHVALSRHVQQLQAVDFVALGCQPGSIRIAFVEAKDYRDAHHPPRLKELAEEVAAKVAGTLAGITAGCRSEPPRELMRTAAGRLTQGTDPLHVIIHFEAPVPGSVADAKSELVALAQLVEQRLSWLPRCRVITCSEAVPKIPDCTVTSA